MTQNQFWSEKYEHHYVVMMWQPGYVLIAEPGYVLIAACCRLLTTVLTHILKKLSSFPNDRIMGFRKKFYRIVSPLIKPMLCVQFYLPRHYKTRTLTDCEPLFCLPSPISDSPWPRLETM